MGTYIPRHLAPEPSLFRSKVGRRAAAVTAGAAIVVPALTGMGSAHAQTNSAASASAQGAGVNPTHARPGGGGGSSAPNRDTASADASDATVLRYGSIGDAVQTLQRRLDGLAVDGSFGPKTLAAVKQFQSTHGLAVDGIVGPQTWAALGGAPSGSPGGGGGGSTASSSSVVEIAKQYIGTPYVYGGNSPSGFDCSGLIQYVFAQAGIDVPRTASAQQAAATPVSNPQPGDIVFFGNPAYHDGIYIGGGKMISARKPGTVVDIGGMYAPHTFGRLG